MALRHSDSSRQSFHREAGNVFFALFGTIVLLGALGATVSNFIKGPLTSSVQVTRANAAETQMAVITQVITMQAASVGSCDGDAEVEPIQWRNPAASEPIPTGGGLVPLTLGVASTKDPWGSEFGYCVWDHGSSLCGGGRRLAGTAVNSDTHTVIAVISPGPDKRFTTTCRTFAAADVTADGDLNDPTDFPLVAKAAATDDDIIYTYSYEEAATASGGLWSLKSSDDTIATIDKNLEVGGSGIFSSGGQFGSLNTDSISARTGDFISLMQGLKIPDATSFNLACNDAISGVLRRSASGLEVCVDDSWRAATGGGASTGGGSGPGNLEEGTADDCDSAGTGDIRYNPNALAVEYCNGTSWQSLLARSSGAALSITPSSIPDIIITGPCVTTNCPYAYGTPLHFVVTNLATSPTAALSVGGFGTGGARLVIDSTQASSCQGAVLPVGGTCIVRALPGANGNGDSYGAVFVLDGGNTYVVPLKMTASGMTCQVGTYGWGGIVASCLNSTTPDYVLMPPGCELGPAGTITYIEPSCSGDPANDPDLTNDSGRLSYPDVANRNSGAQNIANYRAYGPLSYAMSYCDGLVKDGYDDWFLPSIWELYVYIYPNTDELGIDMTERYWTSTYSGPGYGGALMYRYDFNNNWVEGTNPDQYDRVRCMRRHGQGAATAEIDTNPDIIILSQSFFEQQAQIIPPKYTVSASQSMTSEDFIVTSINTPTQISISGPGTPRIRINGGSPVASGTIRNGDLVQATGTGPAAPGTENGFVITIGGEAYVWRVAYPAANTRRIFVTSTTYNGNRGGLAGADANCQTQATAAGLTGNWYAVLASRLIHAKNRVPWGWNRLENMQGELVATSIVDLFDQWTESPVHYSETGARVSAGIPWVGLNTDDGRAYEMHDDTNRLCSNWTSSAAGVRGTTGMSSSLTRSLFYHSEQPCNVARPLYCMGPF